MADKPSRALVVYGDGLTRFIDSSHTHLHSLASMASCGFLSLPNSPSSESEDERVVREFAILMDSCEAYLNSRVETQSQSSSIPTISERFMGMKAALITTSPSLESFGSSLGLTALKSDEFARNSAALLGLLGFRDGKATETSRFDLVFVHFVADDNNAESLDSMVGEIMESARPGSEIGSRLHLSVVTSFGAITQNDDPSESSVSISANEKLSVLLPRQSYTMRGETERKDVRHYCPMLLAQLQYGVTRKDLAETFSFGDFKERGGNLVIPADRFLHEVAFKLWKAPKYGA